MSRKAHIILQDVTDPCTIIKVKRIRITCLEIVAWFYSRISFNVLFHFRVNLIHSYFHICSLILNLKKGFCFGCELNRYLFLPGNSYRDILHSEKKPFYHKGLEEDSNIMDAYLMHSVRTFLAILCFVIIACKFDFWVSCSFWWLNNISCSSITYLEQEILWERMMQKLTSTRKVGRRRYFQVIIFLIKGSLAPRYIC